MYVCVQGKKEGRKEGKEEGRKESKPVVISLKSGSSTMSTVFNHVNKSDPNSKNEASGELQVLNTSRN